jgi:adenylate cyclase
VEAIGGETMAENVVRQRLAAILAADVAGYSRLMGDDERATIDAINHCRAIFREHIEANGGRVVDMAGDSVLAIFDTAIGAFTTAIAAQERLAHLNADFAEDRRMLWRIGVNTGDIHEQDDGTVYGDGINVAARLEGLAEPGGICASDKVHTEVRGKLDRDFADLGEHEVKNIAEPVRAYRVLAEGEVVPTKPNRTHLLALAGAVAAAMVVAAVALWPSSQPAPPPEVATAEPEDPILAMPSGPSIAVLPFDNVSGDPEQDYFSTGLTEDLITRLSRYPFFYVIARGSSSQYGGGDVDVREVGRDLGVRYVIEGSVRKGADTVRVAVQILDAENGNQLWGEAYDRELTAANVFAVQDEITGQVAAIIADQYGVIFRAEVEALGGKQTDSLDAYDCVLRLTTFYDVIAPDEHLKLRDCLERAVEVDPDYAQARASLAWIYLDEYRFGFNPRPDPLERALEAARHAIRLDGDNEDARNVLAATHFHRHDVESFFVEADRAIALNPNNASLLAELGQSMIFVGELDRGFALVKKAIALNPKHPEWYHFAFVAYHFQRHEYELALDAALKINMPEYWAIHGWLAGIYGHLGRTAEARAEAETVLELWPTYAEEYREKGFLRWNFPDSQWENFAGGLRKAGLDIREPTN